MTVPVSDPNLQTAAGSAVKWDTARAKQLFADLRNDTPLTHHQVAGQPPASGPR